MNRLVINCFLSFLLICMMSFSIFALENGLARTPPMGWNSWNTHLNPSETLIKETADAMVASGMRDAGYLYVNMDDAWHGSRDANGYIQPNPNAFPNGMKAVADYVHSKGLKLGIYTDAGTLTCGGFPGSKGYEQKDADQYAAWGIDYVKDDWCYTTGQTQQDSYTLMSNCLRNTGRPIVFSICCWSFPGTWVMDVGNLWRTTGDIYPEWGSICNLIDNNNNCYTYAGPGHWNDPDMLEVSNGFLTAEENRAHFSMWCIMAAPLIAGNDIRTMTTETRDILTAPEPIAVDQDALGIQGRRVLDNGDLEVWAKPLSFGNYAVALFNRGAAAANITANWSDIGIPAGSTFVVRNLWTRQDIGFFTNSFSSNVPSHGVVFVKLTIPTSTPSKLELSSSRSLIDANGISISTITARIYDSNNNLVNSTATITFTLTGNAGGSLTGTNPIKASGGIAAVTYTAGTTAGTATITGTSAGLTQASTNITLTVNHAPNAPQTLLCGGQVNPANLTDFVPTLSWTFSDQDPGDSQSAYRIIVANSQANINSNTGNMWDTNRVTSSANSATYAGASLQTSTQYWWKAMAWDSFGLAGAYSTAGTFTMTNQLPSFALQFDGTSGSAQTGASASLDITGSNASGLTIELWIKKTNLHTDECYLAHCNPGGQGGYWFGLAANKLRISVNANGTWTNHDSTADLTAGVWHHAAAVVTAGRCYLFMDGTDVSPVSSAMAMPTTESNASCFLGNDVWNNHASAVIDEARISNIARYTASFTSPATEFSNDTNTKGLWHLNEGAGQATVDASGNNNTLTINSGVAWVTGCSFATTPGTPTITVVSPNGGENWTQGTTNSVTWTSANLTGNVDIEISYNGASGPWTAIRSATANDGIETITAPTTLGTSCRVRVKDVSGTPLDYSDNNFTISNAPQPVVSASPAMIDFGNIVQGQSGTNTLNITNSGTGTLTGAITSNRPWLTLNPASFNANSAAVTVSVNTTGLAEGTNTGAITVTTNGGTATVNVTVNVTQVPQQNPQIYLSTTTLSFGELEIGSLSQAKVFKIKNDGGGTLTGTIGVSDNWITIDKASLNLAAQAEEQVSVSVDNSVLAQKEGPARGEISIISNGNNGAQVTSKITVEFTATCVLAKPNPVNLNSMSSSGLTRGSNPLITFYGDGIVHGQTTIRIYTLGGELIDVISRQSTVDGPQQAQKNYGLWTEDSGHPSITWTPSNLSPGIYIYVYESPKEKGVSKFTVIK